MTIKTRPGTFAIKTNGGDVFENVDQREELRLIMESVIIISAVHIVSLDQISYIALSEQFEKKEVGETVPGYIPTFLLDDVGNRVACVWESVADYNNLTNGVKQ